MTTQPTFKSPVLSAFHEIASRSKNIDFFVAKLNSIDNTLDLYSSGKGGLRSVKRILSSEFSEDVGVALFRVTAVDDRGKVKSYRSKLIHVIFCGERVTVMRRAKMASNNLAFKAPFTMNLSIQLQPDEMDDFTERSLEKSLRASGGAHQPTSFDFDNNDEDSMLASPRATGQEQPTAFDMANDQDERNESPPDMRAPFVPSSPGGTRVFTVTWNAVNSAFHARDAQALVREYAPDDAKLIITRAASAATSVHQGSDEIQQAFEEFFTEFPEEYDILRVEKFQPDTEHGSEGVIHSTWTSEGGDVFGSETLCIVGGRVVVHTLTVFRHGHVQEEEVLDQIDDAKTDDGAEIALSTE